MKTSENHVCPAQTVVNFFFSKLYKDTLHNAMNKIHYPVCILLFRGFLSLSLFFAYNSQVGWHNIGSRKTQEMNQAGKASILYIHKYITRHLCLLLITDM